MNAVNLNEVSMNGSHRVTVTYRGRTTEFVTFASSDHLTKRLARGVFYELDVLEAARALHFPETAIVDVGAHIGNHTLFLARETSAHLYAIEANPAAHLLLCKNVAHNGMTDRVTILRGAAGAARGKGRIVLEQADNQGEARFVQGDGDLPLFPLDSLNITQPVTILKVDVEGMELAVLQGAERMLRTWHPYIFVEAHGRSQLAAIAAHLSSIGYIIDRRYGLSPTYLFSALDQANRQKQLIEWARCG